MIQVKSISFSGNFESTSFCRYLSDHVIPTPNGYFSFCSIVNIIYACKDTNKFDTTKYNLVFCGKYNKSALVVLIYSRKRGMDIEKRNRFFKVFCKLVKDSELVGVLLLLGSRGDT